MRAVLFVLLVTLSAGCSYGPTAKTFRAAQKPAGIYAVITTQSREVTGELVAVRDEGLIVLEERTLRLVPFSVIDRAEFDQAERLKISSGRRVDAPARARLSLVCRFPQGLTPALLTELLLAYGQNALAGVDR